MSHPYSFDLSNLKHKFQGYENLTKNFSQADQDIFVLSMLDGKRNGSYLEIGCGHSFKNNNTALLETEFDWHGVSIDLSTCWIDSWSRKNPAVLCNAVDCDYIKLLTDHAMHAGDLDYLSLDCDPPDQTLKILYELPFDKLRFAIITFEHDCYKDGPLVKQQSREYLYSLGYELVVSNVSGEALTGDFEDWWVHPNLVNRSLIDLHKDLRDIPKDYGWYLYNRIPKALENTTWIDQFYQNTSN